MNINLDAIKNVDFKGIGYKLIPVFVMGVNLLGESVKEKQMNEEIAKQVAEQVGEAVKNLK